MVDFVVVFPCRDQPRSPCGRDRSIKVPQRKQRQKLDLRDRCKPSCGSSIALVRSERLPVKAQPVTIEQLCRNRSVTNSEHRRVLFHVGLVR